MLEPLAVLKSQPYFRVLDDKELEHLARELVEHTYRRGEIIFLEGETCRGLYIIGKGSVNVYKLSHEGREQSLRTLHAGESFNEVAVFDGGTNPANASALEVTTIWVVPREAMMDLIKRRQDAALAVIGTLGARLRQMVGLVEDLSLRQVSGRVAKLLLQIASGEEPVMTQRQMAARLGTVREMIARSLRQLESRGMIRIERRKIVILNREGLSELV